MAPEHLQHNPWNTGTDRCAGVSLAEAAFHDDDAQLLRVTLELVRRPDFPWVHWTSLLGSQL